jgi:hypothetical protein
MKVLSILAPVAGLVASVNAGYGSVAYTTEVVTAYTTVCPVCPSKFSASVDEPYY